MQVSLGRTGSSVVGSEGSEGSKGPA